MNTNLMPKILNVALLYNMLLSILFAPLHEQWSWINDATAYTLSGDANNSKWGSQKYA